MKKCIVLACVVGLVVAVLGVNAFAKPSVAPAAEGEITVVLSPQTVVLGSKGGTISAHTSILRSQVVGDSVELNGISAYLVKADCRGYMVAKFSVDAIKAIVAPPSATLTLTGVTTTGVSFSGSDTIVVLDIEKS